MHLRYRGRVSQMKFEDTNQQPATLLEQYDYTYTGLNLG